MPDNFVELEFPIRGMDTSREFGGQVKLTTIFALNTRATDFISSRTRGASRPGLERYIPTQVNGNSTLIQHLGFVVDPQGDAMFVEGDEEDELHGHGRRRRYRNDPSTNNRRRRRPLGVIRRVRRRGSGRGVNRKYPKKQIEILWSNPADIIVGTPLSAIQLNALCLTTVCNFVYTPEEGRVLKKGKRQPLKVTAYPIDNTFKTKSKTVYINVINPDDDPGNPTLGTEFYGVFISDEPGDDDLIEVRKIVRNLTTNAIVSDTSLGNRLLTKFSDGIDNPGENVAVYIPENSPEPYGYRGNAGS